MLYLRNIVARAHLQQARDLINQLAKKTPTARVKPTKNGIYYLHDDDSDDIFPWIKVLI